MTRSRKRPASRSTCRFAPPPEEEKPMEATITLGSDYVVPEEERLTAARGETYARLLGRLSHQSVVKHFDAYADIDWEAAEFRVDPEDPRWELSADDPLGATAWYRAQSPATRARLGLHLVATKMRIGAQFENALQAPFILGPMAQIMMRPSGHLVRTYAIPKAVVAEAYTANPRHRESVVASLAKLRDLCREIGIITPWSVRLWQAAGIWQA